MTVSVQGCDVSAMYQFGEHRAVPAAQTAQTDTYRYIRIFRFWSRRREFESPDPDHIYAVIDQWSYR